MAFVFFRIPKPKKFRYKPLFYNELRDGNVASPDAPRREFDHESFRAELRQRWRKKDAAKRRSRGISALVITVLLIALLLYLIFFR